MKLYDTLRAPNPRRVRWFMAEKGIDDIEVIDVDIMVGRHKAADYLDKAGQPNVPMLEMDDGLCLTESVAICRYLESRYPEPNMFGRTPEEAAVIEMWMRRVELQFAYPFMLGVRHTHPALAVLEDQDKQAGEHFLQRSTRQLKMLDDRLASQAWLAADRLTMADILAFTAVDFGRMIRFRLPEELVHLGRWAESMRARPAATAGMVAAAAE